MATRKALNAIIVGSLATLVGVGLSRFAYTPLLPAVIEHGWFTSAQAAYLGAANLLGYLLGALFAHSLLRRFSSATLLRIAFTSVSLSFLCCAWHSHVVVFFSARLISGIAGGLLMVIGPSWALSQLSPHAKARYGPLAFTGIGLGALLAATCVPLLTPFSLPLNWMILSALSAITGLWASQLISTFMPLAHAAEEKTPFSHAVIWVLIAYAFDAAGFIAHTVFWVDFLAREAQLGTPYAAFQWGIFGLGAMCGPFIGTGLNRLFGSEKALLCAFGVKAIAIFLPVVSLSWVSQSLSSFWVGALTPALVSLTATYLAALLPSQSLTKAWGIATAAFAFTQALSGYGMAFFYSHTHSYYPLFSIGACCLLLGTGCVWLSVLTRKSSCSSI